MLHNIMEGFLYDPKQAKPDFIWQSAGYFILEVDLYSLSLAEFLAPALDPRNDTQIFQL